MLGPSHLELSRLVLPSSLPVFIDHWHFDHEHTFWVKVCPSFTTWSSQVNYHQQQGASGRVVAGIYVLQTFVVYQLLMFSFISNVSIQYFCQRLVLIFVSFYTNFGYQFFSSQVGFPLYTRLNMKLRW